MNIVVLSGSPRADGNTVSMVQAFREGAEEAGHKVKVFDVAKMNLKGCLACEYCHTKGEGLCIQQDDMQLIYPAVREADVLVLASPVYYFTLSAQTQMALQRLYCIGKPPKKMALLLSSHSPNVYAAAKSQLEQVVAYCGGQSLGVITAFGEENKSAAKLEECRTFGKNMRW